jgi:hypothetical protein
LFFALSSVPMNQNILNRNIVRISQHLSLNIGDLTQGVNVFLTNLKGDIVVEQKNLNDIDITSQPRGLYIAFLTDLQGGLIKKIRVIKE